MPWITNDDLESMDRNARSYGYDVGRGHSLSKVIVDGAENNPFLDPSWRDTIEENPVD